MEVENAESRRETIAGQMGRWLERMLVKERPKPGEYGLLPGRLSKERGHVSAYLPKLFRTTRVDG